MKTNLGLQIKRFCPIESLAHSMGKGCLGPFCLILILMPTLASSQSEPIIGQLEERQLEPGHSLDLEFPSDSDLTVSRKGVVDLDWISGQKWRATALKKGIVIIKAFDRLKQERVRTVIRVQDQTQNQMTKISIPSLSSYPTLCHHKGVTCLSAGQVVTGQTDSWSWYLEAYELCHKIKYCQFQVLLSSRAQVRLGQQLEMASGSPVGIQRLDSGVLIVTTACRKQQDSPLYTLFEQPLRQKLLSIRCRQFPSQAQITLKAKIFYLKEGDGDEMGLQWRNLLDPEPTIKAFLSRHKNRLISEPTLLVQPHSPFELHSGAEMRVISQGKDPEEHWRPTGLVFSGQIWPTEPKSYQLEYQLKLSVPIQGDNQRVHAAVVSSQANLRLAQGQIVGEIDSHFHEEGAQNIPILGDIPIIWPLFTFDYASNGHAKVYIWVRLDLGDGK